MDGSSLVIVPMAAAVSEYDADRVAERQRKGLVALERRVADDGDE